MKKFDVEITETLQRTVSVEAASQEEAEKIVTKAWNNEDYVLDSADFVGVDFKTVGDQELSESRKMEVLLVQPGMYPQKATIGTELKDFQDAVGGTIAASYPFDDPVAIVYNDEGKLTGLPLNRAFEMRMGGCTTLLLEPFWWWGWERRILHHFPRSWHRSMRSNFTSRKLF